MGLSKYFSVIAASLLSASSLFSYELLNPAKPMPEISVVAKALRKQTAELGKAPDGAPAVKISWSNADSNKMEFFFEKGADLPEFQKAKIYVDIYLEQKSFCSNFSVRLIDSKVEIFQIRKFLKADELEKGWNTISFDVNPMDFEKDPNIRTWGRNANKKIDYPAQLFGFCIDFAMNRGAGILYLGKVRIETLK